MLSTPPLTATATRPMPSSTAVQLSASRRSSASPSPLSRRACASASCRRRARAPPGRPVRRRSGRSRPWRCARRPAGSTTLTATSPLGAGDRHALARQHRARLDPPAQADRRGLSEAALDHRVQPLGPRQHLDLRREPALLADRGELDHVEHAVAARAARRGRAPAPPGSGRRPRSASTATCSSLRPPRRLLVGQHAQRVADAGQAPACRSRCRSRRAARARAAGAAPRRDGAGSRRRSASPARPRCRRRSPRSPASSSAVAGAGTGRAPWLVAIRPLPTGSGAVDQLGRRAPRSAQAAPTTSAIEVPVGELVEMDLVDRPAVHPGLGLGERGEDRDRALAHAGLAAAPSRAASRISTKRAVRRVLGRRAGGSIATRLPVSTPSSCAQSRTCQSVGQAGRAHRGEGALGELGPGVEQGGQEHVAGDAAQRVEMDVGACPMRGLRPPADAPGTT